MLSLPFFSERMRDGSPAEFMAEGLWDEHAGYDDDGAALACSEGGISASGTRFTSWATSQTGIIPCWHAKK